MTGARNRASGFTLVELMIVLAIVAILVTIAIPNLRNLIAKSELKDAAGGLTAALYLARSEAIKRGADVGVCSQGSATACGAAASDWKKGWRVYVDADNGGSFNTGDEELRSWPPTATRLSFSETGTWIASSQLMYRGNGLSRPGGVCIKIDTSGYDFYRDVEISPTGRPAIFTDSDISSICGR